MIAIDTNVLLRYLLDDDKQQSPKADKLINGQHTVLITDIVLVETLWTLRGKKYNLNKNQLIAVIQQLFAEPNIRFEDGQTVLACIKRLPPGDTGKSRQQTKNG